MSLFADHASERAHEEVESDFDRADDDGESFGSRFVQPEPRIVLLACGHRSTFCATDLGLCPVCHTMHAVAAEVRTFDRSETGYAIADRDVRAFNVQVARPARAA